LAEFPDRVKACFRTQEVNGAGIYEMDFYIGGVKTSVVVDDYVPIVPEGYVGAGKPAFCSTKSEELWAILMEKAFAKLHGNFDVMQSGKSGMALHLITGFPEYDFLH
jgi:calpain-15